MSCQLSYVTVNAKYQKDVEWPQCGSNIKRCEYHGQTSEKRRRFKGNMVYKKTVSITEKVIGKFLAHNLERKLGVFNSTIVEWVAIVK